MSNCPKKKQFAATQHIFMALILLQSYLPKLLSGSFLFWEGLELKGRWWMDQRNIIGQHSEFMITHSLEMRFLKVDHSFLFYMDFIDSFIFILKLNLEKILNFHTCKILGRFLNVFLIKIKQ